MQNDKTDDRRVTFDALVRELLGLEPSVLVAMDPGERSAAAGLHLFMRRTLERALGSLWAPDTKIFRLCSDATAKTLDWPNAALCNLSTLFAWALVREPRRSRGLSDLRLLPADPFVIDLPQKYAVRTTVDTGSVVAMARALLRTEGAFRSSGFSEPLDLSVGKVVEDMVGVQAEALFWAVHETPRDDGEALASDPDDSSALAAWLMAVLDASVAIVARNIQTVGFIIVDEARDPVNARASNLTALFIAALLHDERDVTFFAQEAA